MAFLWVTLGGWKLLPGYGEVWKRSWIQDARLWLLEKKLFGVDGMVSVTSSRALYCVRERFVGIRIITAITAHRIASTDTAQWICYTYNLVIIRL